MQSIQSKRKKDGIVQRQNISFYTLLELPKIEEKNHQRLLETQLIGNRRSKQQSAQKIIELMRSKSYFPPKKNKNSNKSESSKTIITTTDKCQANRSLFDKLKKSISSFSSNNKHACIQDNGMKVRSMRPSLRNIKASFESFLQQQKNSRTTVTNTSFYHQKQYLTTLELICRQPSISSLKEYCFKNQYCPTDRLVRKNHHTRNKEEFLLLKDGLISGW